MLIVIAFLLIISVCVGPMIWAQYVLRKHARHRSDYPGTGGEFARHILDMANLHDIEVENSLSPDHYDPVSKTVRLNNANYNGQTLTAVVVAAHEVGHALQDRDKYKPLIIRTQFAYISHIGEIVAKAIIIALPALILFSPRLLIIAGVIFAAIVLIRISLHLITLPVEIDASFNRALPILDKGNFLPKSDIPAAKSILNACVWTYVSATIFSILDILRWLRPGR